MSSMHYLTGIALWLMVAAATAYFANQRGRDPVVWFMLAMLLGWLALLILFFLAPVKEDEQPQEAEYALLDAKNDILPFSHDYLILDWYYYDRHQDRNGPVPFETLKTLWKDGSIDDETYVWSEGMEEWKKIADIPSIYIQFKLAN